MKLLSLTNSDRPAIVDDDIYELVKDRSWRVMIVTNGAKYIVWKSRKNGKHYTIYLHRFVMDALKGMIDHINGDPFDNRRENLRAATNAQNQMNSRKQSGRSSVYKGVSWDKQHKKWKAQIRVDGKDFKLGVFSTERHAAYAVELSRPALHGRYARSNFTSNEIAGMFVDASL